MEPRPSRLNCPPSPRASALRPNPVHVPHNLSNAASSLQHATTYDTDNLVTCPFRALHFTCTLPPPHTALATAAAPRGSDGSDGVHRNPPLDPGAGPAAGERMTTSHNWALRLTPLEPWDRTPWEPTQRPRPVGVPTHRNASDNRSTRKATPPAPALPPTRGSHAATNSQPSASTGIHVS
jgi:hypothetical protein